MKKFRTAVIGCGGISQVHLTALSKMENVELVSVADVKEDRAKAKAEAMGITVKEDAGRGWRQVVASPIPKRIVEFDAVRDLVEDGYVVVSTGGGGVPVFETENGYVGTPAVIDKDRSSALMAAELGADMLIILTAVEKVCINFNTPEQEQISEMTVSQAREYIAQGQFAPGLHAAEGGGLHRVRRELPRGQGAHHLAGVRGRGTSRRDGHRHRRRLSCSK